MITPRKLAVPSRVRRFRCSEEKLFREHLASQEASFLFEVKKASDVLLDDRGRVQGEYQFTTTALSQLCSRLAPGLGQALSDVAGLQGETDTANSFRLAVSIINAIIKLRFATRVCGLRLLFDRRSHRVEGVVGPRYNLLPNGELLERCQQFVNELSGGTCVFHEAVLEGRQMLLRYRNVARAFTLPVESGGNTMKDSFTWGWHFTNSEVGDKSVQGAALLIRDFDSSASLAPSTDVNRVIHVRSDHFREKVTEALEQLRRRTMASNEMRTSLVKLCQQSLDAGLTTVAGYTARRKSLVSKLVRAKVPAKLAEQVVDRALVAGSFSRVSVEVTPQLLDRIRGRSAYDVYTSLTHIARRQEINRRELTEQLAYRMLTGRFTLT